MLNRLVNSFWLILISISSFASPTIYKEWVNEDLHYLELTKKKALFDYGSNMENYGVKYEDNTLTLIDYFYTSGKLFRQHEDYVFRILKAFVDKKLLYKPDLKFERLFFQGTPCLGTCPGMKLEIDSSGQVHFYGEYYTGQYIGFYKAQLNNEQLNRLVEILKKSELDRFPEGLGQGVDAPTYTFKFRYNNRVKASKGSHVPYFNKPLLRYLLAIYTELTLIKSDEEYRFDGN
ncbi:MAG: hypothetical protein K0S53_3393 [Bacteroidetes bacterium]|nr:hypothetical protein [Bacteroidota bacterium]